MTNLIYCVRKPTPTGIDRIDLIYACFLIRSNWIELRPVYVKGTAVYSISRYRLERITKRVRKIWAGKEPAKTENGIFGKSIRGVVLRWFHRKLTSKFHTADKGYYVNISQRNLANSGVIEWIRCRSHGAVCMIHDLLPITNQSCFNNHAKERHEEKLHAMMSAGAIMVCGSRSCQVELMNFANRTGVSKANTLYASFGCKRPSHSLLDNFALPSNKPFFLMLASFEPRKNHHFLLKVWSEIIELHGLDNTPILVMAGRMSDFSKTILEVLADDPKLAAKVFIINDASDSHISALIKSAEAMLIPSIAEGYGLPLYEAFANETPVIAAEIDIFKELNQNIARLIPLDRPDLWIQSILDFSKERERQIQILRNWRRPTWASHFRVIIHALSNIHEGRNDE